LKKWTVHLDGELNTKGLSMCFKKALITIMIFGCVIRPQTSCVWLVTLEHTNTLLYCSHFISTANIKLIYFQRDHNFWILVGWLFSTACVRRDFRLIKSNFLLNRIATCFDLLMWFYNTEWGYFFPLSFSRLFLRSAMAFCDCIPGSSLHYECWQEMSKPLPELATSLTEEPISNPQANANN